MAESLKPLKQLERPALSGWPMVIAWLGMLIFAFHASTHMVGAGDTWVAMACGRHFVNHGVDTIEPFSANSHKAGPTEEEIAKWPNWAQGITKLVGLDTFKKIHPTGWLNQNWLTHVQFYWLTHLSPASDGPAHLWEEGAEPNQYSYNNLVYWKIGLYVLTVICVYYTGRILGVNPALAAAFACFSMFVARSFLDIRPAGYSNLLVAVFLLVLVLATHRHILYIWLIVPLTVFWCNLHGGYIYVFIIMVPFVVFHFLAYFVKDRFISMGVRGLCHTVAAGAATLVACIIFNPFHLTNFTHTFVISVSKHAEMWRTVHEWHPGFAWNNPVGTGFPFLIVFMLFIVLVFLWLFSKALKPRMLTAPVNQLERQKSQFAFLLTILGWSAAVFLCWVGFVSLSFCRADVWSLFICVLFVGIILLATTRDIHFSLLLLPVTLTVVWLSKDSKGFEGRYIYPFLILPVFVLLGSIFNIVSQKRLFRYHHIFIVLGVAVVSILLMTIIFNPFKFESFADKGFAWFGQFWTIKRPWKPPYEANLGFLSNAYRDYLFKVLHVVNLLAIGAWMLVPDMKKLFATKESPVEETEQQSNDVLNLPKYDIAFMVVCAMTVYMAFRSRRFITIAAFAACPILAMFIDQMVRTVAASLNFHRNGRLAIPEMSRGLQRFFAVLGTVVVVVLGTWWGLKFKRVYLDPWPNDNKLTSVFMRMTASHAKPFWACQFIRENRISGKMFNYWTEGGFIGYGQIPDPNSGKTPLQLFMDGRAQAAYEPHVFKLWSEIMAGTHQGRPVIAAAKLRGKPLSASDYGKVGQAISKVLRKHNVWVLMMPTGPKTNMIIRSMDNDPEWQAAFYNTKQKIFVDTTKPRGKALMEGIFTGETKFPDEFSRHLTASHNLLLRVKDEATAQAGLKHAMEAFSIYPSQVAMLEILKLKTSKKLAPVIGKFCYDAVEDFVKNREEYTRQDGYIRRASGTMQAAAFLRMVAAMNKAQDRVKYYENLMQEIQAEARVLSAGKVW